MAAASSLIHSLSQHADRLGDRPWLRFRRLGVVSELSWRAVRSRVRSLAAHLIERGIEPGDRVALLSENRPEWLVVDLAVQSAGAAVVPMHAPLAAAQVRHQIGDSGAKLTIAAKKGDADLFFDDFAWHAALERGRRRLPELEPELDRRERALTGADLATILYTSGTTGEPKGVMLTHNNLLSNAASMVEAVGPFDDSAVFFNWLPLSHIYARLCDAYLALLAGCTLAFAESQNTIVADLAQMHGTHFSAVPRFYEKLLASVPRDRLGRIFAGVSWLNSGGAPLPRTVLDAYREAGLVIHQGYGLTETSPVISTNRRHANRPGTVGQPISGVQIRIADDGEIWTRGPHVMAGYWKHPSPLVDGWLPTGDLGRLDADGFLTITGRKKDLIVLSSGKNVAPTRIEALLAREPAIEQAIVIGDGRPYLTALVVPRTPGACEAELLRRIEAALVDVSPWEQVRKIAIVEKPFTVDAGELTVSAKLRRGVICEKHRQRIEALYAS